MPCHSVGVLVPVPTRDIEIVVVGRYPSAGKFLAAGRYYHSQMHLIVATTRRKKYQVTGKKMNELLEVSDVMPFHHQAVRLPRLRSPQRFT